ncbi:hypothetical protein CHU93_13390 [Sandarakinorhabdus cyanobacteriorum]|uniref:DUF2490 domain-containing protein n=1 Tax=Sandarakinorhabdus cyanobacteriorum TaxID=1981098 RepID=A0A255Y8Z9_9SPHN|nr:DUF2490 domain-containing protein [Sandarakinorhabdus cyanobacteriorum]OYQ25716.1 hypothetical protein CHU93_13390 [Sandarakinorhabdus cyanobacteriorum]
MRLIAACLAVPLLALPAAAQDVQSWNVVQAQGLVHGRMLLSVEASTRFADDLSRTSVVFGRVGIGLRTRSDADLYVGYQYQLNLPAPGIERGEHRLWQQVQAPLLRRANGVTLINRWRLEQRWFDDGRDTGLRLRAQLRLQLPLNGKGSAGPLLMAENFVNLNTTDWGQRAGLDQHRSFVGWLQPLSSHLSLEAGYMHVYLNRPGRNPGNHVLSLTLNRRLG